MPEYKIPKIENIPESLYELSIEEALSILGFYKNSYNCLEKTIGNEECSFTTAVSDAGLQWVVSIFIKNKRKLIVPIVFGVCVDITPIELLGMLYKEWVLAFGETYIPEELLHGKTYIEHINMLKSSRPKKPYIRVDRETFRFFINKLKKINKNADEDYLIEFSCSNNQLKIVAQATTLFVPASLIENISTEKISVSAKDFFKMLPKRFIGDDINFSVRKNSISINSSVVNATWNGDDLWEYDEYDKFLMERLLHRATSCF